MQYFLAETAEREKPAKDDGSAERDETPIFTMEYVEAFTIVIMNKEESIEFLRDRKHLTKDS